MSKLVLAAGSVRTLQVTKRWFNLLNASHPFVIRFEHDEVVGMVGRQYDFENIKRIEIHNPSDDELRIEYEIAHIHITSVADGNVKVVNSISVDEIKQQVNVKINDEVKVLARSEVGLGLDSLDDIDIEPQQSKKVIDANPNRKELILQNTSANPVEIRVGGANVGQRNGGIIKAGGALGLSNGAAVYAFNTDQQYAAKLSIIEVLL
ncbi:hypothetical protein C1E23_01145 [Pseudoalteromonas phenolica]|uniref:Uncharacterized protein n=1 Tax=Pseudoalteromonas phenolica TaxID=161398 RepID=A0A4Q7IS85_9GAMM|nr:hypothetical protein [Pseudoalteromonas phenolica]RZQ54920.1 hypothetical protein C1E23_01145 [Pseudoalteromonas phenolica]